MTLEQGVLRLRTENAALRQLLTDSQERLQAALAHIAELEAQIEHLPARPPWVKPNRAKKERPPAPRQKRAACLGALPGVRLSAAGREPRYMHKVIEPQVIKRWCPHCAGWHSPQVDLCGQVLGQGRIGVRVAAWVSQLRTTLRLPNRAIQEYLQTLHGWQLSVGESVALVGRVGQALEPEWAELRQSPVVQGDATGWREDGQNGYVWVFATPEGVRYYEYDRSHWVPLRVLGPDFKGYLGSDFYASAVGCTCCGICMR